MCKWSSLRSRPSQAAAASVPSAEAARAVEPGVETAEAVKAETAEKGLKVAWVQDLTWARSCSLWSLPVRK
jgi:hypothetical protein